MNTIIDEIKSLLISSYKGEERVKGLVTKDFLSSTDLKKVTYNALKIIYPLKFEGKDFELSDQEFDHKYEYALRLVRLTYLTTIEASSSLTENQDQETWLTEKRIGTIGWEDETRQTYRRRYIKYLTAIRPASVINETKESSLSILRKIGDPHSEHEFFVKGLVVGSVQSGKTSNFNAVINSCIDAGYQLIIVLSGLMEDLRQQTQIRIEKEVQGKMLTQGDFIGVGKISSFGQQGDFPHVNQIVVPTSLENDFGLNMQQAQFDLNQINVLVCKKNTSVLQNLLLWLNDYLNEHTDKLDLPFIIIDDEADNASLNNSGSKGKEFATKINGHIRALLALFKRKTYIGYTATPFANILQDYNDKPDNKWPINDRRSNTIIEFELVDNLFPKDFIELLNPPSNYIGPKNFFETRIEDIKKIETLISDPIKEHIKFFPERVYREAVDGKLKGVKKYLNKHEFDSDPSALSQFESFKNYRGLVRSTLKDDAFPIAIPPSLDEAVKCFILGIAVRLNRRPQLIESSNFQPHNSMLIHISRYSNWQCTTKELVLQLLAELKPRIDHDKLNGSDSIYEEFERIWNKHFEYSNQNIKTFLPENYEDEFLTKLTFNDVKKFLPQAIKDIDVKAVNTIAKDQLDYSSGEKKYIVIGGNKLSRGYTLEGLTINYFVRGTNLADTLLQMGRWFGYRPGYLDCCKLFTTKESLERFDLVTWTIEELEQDFKTMANAKKKPIDFATKVLTHPGVIQITRAPILKNANLIKGSFSDKLVQSTEFDLDNIKVKDSWNTFKNVYSSYSDKFKHNKNDAFITLKTDVVGLKQFLDSSTTITHKFDKQSILGFIELCNEQDFLRNWTIGIRIKGSNDTFALSKENSGFLKDVQFTKRSGSENGKYNTQLLEQNIFKVAGSSSNIITGAEDLSIILDQDQITKARENFSKKNPNKGRPERIYRELIPQTDGVLLIYLIDRKAIYSNLPEPDKNRHDQLDRSIPLVGFALGIPPIGDDIGDDFLVNQKILENIRIQELEEQDELEEIEDELAGIEE